MIGAAPEEEDIAAPRRVDPRWQLLAVELLATHQRQVTATLHLEAMNHVRPQATNQSRQPRRLFEVIKILKQGCRAASAAAQRPGQTSLPYGCRNIFPSSLHKRVDRYIFELGMNSIVGAVWEHVDVPILTLQLPNPTRDVNTLA